MDHREFEARKIREREQAHAEQLRTLDNEMRICTRCGWRQTKKYCLQYQIKACPRCGNTQCRATSMDFDDRMLQMGAGRPG